MSLSDIMMSLIGPGAPQNETQRNVNDALMRYFTLKGTEDIGEHLFGGPSGLEKENMQLDIAMKRRSLGLPEDTDEFNDEINSPNSRILSSLGIHFLDRLQSPQVIQPEKSFGEGVAHVLARPRRGASAGASAVLRRIVGSL